MLNHAVVTRLGLDLYHLLRLSAFGASAVLPLQGAASTAVPLKTQQALGLVGVAAAFHAAVYLDNDLCDLELDRSQPLRAHYPLVRGALDPKTARGLALSCAVGTLALDGLIAMPGRRGSRQGLLGAALLLLAVYNRWGKRCLVPPLTDLVQGLGWTALLGYGAAATGQVPTHTTHLLGGYELALIMLVNGVHGPLRDLANDAARGARTTALWFGARVDAARHLVVPPTLLTYALLLQLGLFGLLGLAATQPRTPPLARLGVGLWMALTISLLTRVVRGRQMRPVDLGMLHLILILSGPILLVAPGMPVGSRRVLLAAHLVPLLSNRMTYEALSGLGG